MSSKLKSRYISSGRLDDGTYELTFHVMRGKDIVHVCIACIGGEWWDQYSASAQRKTIAQLRRAAIDWTTPPGDTVTLLAEAKAKAAAHMAAFNSEKSE